MYTIIVVYEYCRIKFGAQFVFFKVFLKNMSHMYKWYFVTKIVLTDCVRKNCSSDREKLSKFEAEGREFAKFLRSLEQFIRAVKGQNNF